MDPMWSKFSPISHRLMDPLALSRVSDRMTSELLLGITVLTRRARYYSFYTWVVYDIKKRNEAKDYHQFRQAFYARERAFMMGCLLHEKTDKSGDHDSIVGSNIGSRHFDGTSIKLSFHHLNNPLGGYGYYYRASMRNLGLIEQEPSQDIATPLGEKVALSFEQCIKNTQFFSSYQNASEVPTQILLDYGRSACLCRLPQNASSDRDVLRNLFLGLNSNNLSDTKRRETLLLILYCVDLFAKLKLDLDNAGFLDSAYFHQTIEGKSVFQLSFPKMFDDILQKWRMFRAHDYFAYACESLLSSFLRMLELNEKTGLSLDGFLNMVNDHGTAKELSKNLDVEFDTASLKNLRTLDVLKSLASSIMKKKLTRFQAESSEIFDAKCTLNAEVNERVIFEQLKKHFSGQLELSLAEITALALTLLLVLYARFLHLKVNPNKHWQWMRLHSSGRATDLSPYKFLHHIDEGIMKENRSIFEFLYLFIDNCVIRQHQEVRHEKMLGMTVQRPVSWFRHEGGVYRLDRMHSPNTRSSRFESCLQILKDLGYCKHNGKYTELTVDGVDILHRFKIG